MATLDSKKTLKSLLQKGFKHSTNKSADHIWVEFWYNEKLTRIRTKLSHNGQELNDYLIKMMASQTYLSRLDFVSFAKCTLSESDYIEILKPKGLLE